MIKVTGYNYHNDYYKPVFVEDYEHIGQFIAHIQKISLSRDLVRLPASNEDGTFDQKYACFMAGRLRYSTEYCADGTVNTMCVDLISEGDKILFSSGVFTDQKGHISTLAKRAFESLKQWKEKDYEFAERLNMNLHDITKELKRMNDRAEADEKVKNNDFSDLKTLCLKFAAKTPAEDASGELKSVYTNINALIDSLDNLNNAESQANPGLPGNAIY